MNRLIDQIQADIIDKNLLGEVAYICITKASLKELIEDFNEEFRVEYEELGRPSSISDVQEYLSIPILVEELINEEKYQLLTKI